MATDRRSHKRVVLYRAEVPGETERYEVEYESVSDALHFACRDLRAGRRNPLAIVEDGATVLDAAQIRERCEAEWEEVEERLERAAEEGAADPEG